MGPVTRDIRRARDALKRKQTQIEEDEVVSSSQERAIRKAFDAL